MKKVVSLFLCITLLLCSVVIVCAESDQKLQIRNSEGKLVNFTIESAAKGKLTMDELHSIANSNKDTDNITIYEVGYANRESIDSNEITPKSIPIYVPGSTQKTVTREDVLESDRFMESCAKGETLTIEKTITEELKLSITGDLEWGDLGLNNSIKYSLKRGKVLVGPPENSKYNSREYRCKFFENHGDWTQLWLHSNIPVVHSGSFREPSRYASYSKDTYQ